MSVGNCQIACWTMWCAPLFRYYVHLFFRYPIVHVDSHAILHVQLGPSFPCPSQKEELDKQKAVLCGEYIVPMGDGRIICGATHEYGELDTLLEMSPDLNKAQELLYDGIARLDQKIMRDRTPYMSNQGIRVVPPRSHLGRLPVIANHPADRKIWLLSGLSSRGLIHHALLGSYVSKSIVDKKTIIPRELLLDFDR